jgi:hypothetical protein
MRAIPTCKTQDEVKNAFMIIENSKSKVAKGLLF